MVGVQETMTGVAPGQGWGKGPENQPVNWGKVLGNVAPSFAMTHDAVHNAAP